MRDLCIYLWEAFSAPSCIGDKSVPSAKCHKGSIQSVPNVVKGVFSTRVVNVAFSAKCRSGRTYSNFFPFQHLALTEYCLYHTCRVGQNHIYTVYMRYFWQGNHQIYGHIRCIYTVLANPTHLALNATFTTFGPEWQLRVFFPDDQCWERHTQTHVHIHTPKHIHTCSLARVAQYPSLAAVAAAVIATACAARTAAVSIRAQLVSLKFTAPCTYIQYWVLHRVLA